LFGWEESVLAGSVVVDAVVHPFNIGPENQAAGGEPQLEALFPAVGEGER
jgi:hypothetical protein